VLNPIGVAVVGEAGREPRNDPREPLNLTKQQPAAVSRDEPAVETSYHISPIKGVKSER